MTIIEVQNPKDWKLFHRVPHRIYAKDPNWIAPLEGDVQGTFTSGKNHAFDHGEAKVFVLLDEKDRPAGRIAAFIDHRNNQIQPYPLGGIGYFECINEPDYARALFETAETYLREKGMKAIDGPINFGGRDKFWGLLQTGFDPPLFQETYNPPYYNDLFLANAYIAWEQILTMKGCPVDIDLSRLRAVIERIRAGNNNIQVETYTPAKLEKYADDFTEVYNAAFGHYEHFRPADPEGFKKLMGEVKNIIDPKFLGIAYYEDKPAGFCAFFPDINPYLKFAKGKLNWWKAPLFLLKLKLARQRQAKGTGFGVHPAYKTKGIFAFIVEFMNSDYIQTRYNNIYLTTVRAHNKEAVSIYMKTGVYIDRVHIGYRKSLDESIVVEPNYFMEITPR
ncbi:GNAT family N-acetyltransferase [Haliscomenobacter sp.]|uniref:GNAT family N-acetyltransferase n=1 Tax=Haliscomenobacter sp. TaxID=2717303 RepID=UPI003364DC55